MKFIKRLWFRFIALFKQGLTPIEMLQSVLISLVISLLPFYGIATPALTALSVKYRFNLAIMLAISYLIEPVKILLFIPFVNIGGGLFGAEHTQLTFKGIKTSFQEGVFNAIPFLAKELLYGFVGWLTTVIPIAFVTYIILHGILKLRTKQQVSYEQYDATKP